MQTENNKLEAQSGAEKIMLLLGRLLDEKLKVHNEKTIAAFQEVLIELCKLNARLDVIENLVAEKRQPRKKKPAPVDN